MCGSLKHNDRTVKIGGIVEVTNLRTGKTGRARWNGFAREDSMENVWKKHHPVPLAVHAESFQEQHKVYKLKDNDYICAIGLPNNKTFRIVTREAEGTEKLVHHRFPVTSNRTRFEKD